MKNFEKNNWELFVFDWDGTIMDTTGLIVQGYQHASVVMGYPKPTAEAVRRTIGMNSKDTLLTLCKDIPLELHEKFFQTYRDWYLEREAQVDLVPGMRELLFGMKEAGFRLALATGKSNQGVARVFKKFGLAPIFEAVQTADKSFSKPNPAMMYNLADETGLECRQMVMVGDSPLDLLMASNAGASGIGMTYGAGNPGELKAAPHEALCSCVGDLARALGVEEAVKLPLEAFKPYGV
jgi:phosphoglycolate phosphatase